MVSEEIKKAIDGAIATLEEAKQEVVTAEQSLENLLSELKIAPRAEKTSVSKTIESALLRLRSGRTKVEDAEKTLAKQKELP
jgi:hypothetical protein